MDPTKERLLDLIANDEMDAQFYDKELFDYEEDE